MGRSSGGSPEGIDGKTAGASRQCGAGDDDYLLTSVVSVKPISADRYQYCPVRAHQTVRSFFPATFAKCGFLFHHIVSDIRWQPD